MLDWLHVYTYCSSQVDCDNLNAMCRKATSIEQLKILRWGRAFGYYRRYSGCSSDFAERYLRRFNLSCYRKQRAPGTSMW